MKQQRILFFFLIYSLGTICFAHTIESKWYKNALKRSKKQLLAAANQFRDANKNPRTFENGETVLVSERDWTSGFFPGSLWYMYELTENEQLRTEAERFTAFVEKAQYRTNTHDLGFILYCSYGNGYRITGNEAYKTVMLTGANSLIKRYNVKIGLIKSWDPFVGPWEFPVIIDNMMNLELLFEVGKLTNNKDMKNTCISHANKTLENHFRADNSCFHVVEYDSITGKVLKKQTHQGYSDNSSWARGQAWALYGFTMMYRETKKAEYLKQAQGVATFILSHPHLPEDKIPYWDFDAPNIPNEPRDASAAAVVASALLELSTFVNNKPEYFKTAETILKNLSSDKYLAGKDENGLFILKHSTGNWPEKREMDAPLSYADYYFVEALKRYHDLKMN